MNEDGPLANIESEAERLIAVARNRQVVVRLIGGLAVRLHVPASEKPVFTREYKDIDLATVRGQGKAVAAFLESAGYEPDRAFNATNGSSRLLFYDMPNQRQVDVFVGTFQMCHSIPITDRVIQDSAGIPLAELLLTKLQIVELNAKDQIDIVTMLYHHDLADHDDAHINQAQVARLCAADWGLWRTTKQNLERIRSGLDEAELTADQREQVTGRIDRLWQRIEAEPKSAKWKLRNRVGDRVRWYEEPEEVAQ
jgi:hypothetical protein